jgi:hypothetical protein
MMHGNIALAHGSAESDNEAKMTLTVTGAAARQELRMWDAAWKKPPHGEQK